MRRILPLLLGFLLLLPAAPARSAGDQYADLNPVSPYTQRVVRRVQEGLSAPSGGGSTADTFLKLFWLDQITGVILGTIDTDLRIVEQERDLIANSPCLRIDTLILEGWIERARKMKNDAVQSGNTSEAARLISLQLFLNDRYKALLLGARDPAFEDLDEGHYFSFDPDPLWCCPAEKDESGEAVCASVSGEQARECTRNRGRLFKRHFACVNAGCTASEGGVGAVDEDISCPFSSDYLPPTAAGYGCDLSVLGQYSGTVEGIQKELVGLQTIVRDRDDFIGGMEAARGTVQQLERRLGGGSLDLTNFGAGASARRTHKTVSGCLREGEELPDGVAFWESRGPLSFAKNEIVLMPRLTTLWHSWGGQRLAPEYLRPSRYLPDGSLAQQLMRDWEQNLGSWLFVWWRSDAQEYLKKVSLRQSDAESTELAKTLDAPERILQSLAPLRTEVRGLAQAVQSSDAGIRKFVRNFAAFLRTSCIFRPCSEQLDRVLKITLENKCFPYVNGATLDSDVADQCKSAAGL